MELWRIALSALGSVTTLYLLTRLIGPRQVTELSVFDYLNSITIGSIAAEMALTKTVADFTEALTATLIYGGATLLISYLTLWLPRLRPLLMGRSSTLFSGGVFHRDSMKRAKLDLNEFLMSARSAGYFSLSEIECAILEPNGRISFLEKGASRAVTPEDLSLSVPEAEAPYTVVMEHKLQRETLRRVGYEETWLLDAIKKEGYRLSEVFLATLTQSGRLELFGESKKNGHTAK